jgi:hypothetical protein
MIIILLNNLKTFILKQKQAIEKTKYNQNIF